LKKGTAASPDRLTGTAFERQLKLSLDVWLQCRSGHATRSANLWNLFRRTAEMATKAAEYKARRGLFDLTPPIP